MWKTILIFTFSLQYDVELYQRIEQLIGKKLPLYKTEEQDVMCLQERVAEAQRAARTVIVFSFCLRSDLKMY